MEGGRKRRKLQNIEEEEEEEEDEEEEENMKLFFALIQNTKAMRDRIIKSKDSAQEEKSKGIWNPKFQPEDFMEEDGYGSSNNNKSNTTLQLAASSSSTPKQSNPKDEQQDKDKVGETNKGLDLNLSL